MSISYQNFYLFIAKPLLFNKTFFFGGLNLYLLAKILTFIG